MRKDAPHIIESSSRTELDRYVASENINHSLEDLKAETRPILDATSPFVCALVGGTVKELVNDIPAGSVH